MCKKNTAHPAFKNSQIFAVRKQQLGDLDEYIKNQENENKKFNP